MSENHKQQTEDDEIEIDIGELLFALKKKILLLALMGILGAAAAFFYSKAVLTPTFTSTSMIMVMSKETTITSLTDLQIGSQLTNDYSYLITSRTVMENVINRLGLDTDYLQLREKVKVDNPTDTRILNISVTDHDPMMAKTLTDEVADCASDYISEIMEQAPPKIIEQGEIPLYQTSPNTKMNVLLGAIIGICLVAGVVVLSVLLNDTVQNEDDVMRVTGAPVLAVIPALPKEKAKEKTNEKESGEEKQKRSRRKAGKA